MGNPAADYTVELVTANANAKVQVVGDQVLVVTPEDEGKVVVVGPGGVLELGEAGEGGGGSGLHADLTDTDDDGHPIDVIDGLQAALDAKETPAGAAAQVATHLVGDHWAVRDTFTRANNAASMGTAEGRPEPWLVASGDVWGITGGQAYKPSAGYGVVGVAVGTQAVARVTIAAFDPGDEFWLVGRLGANYVRLGKRAANAAYTFETDSGADIDGSPLVAFPAAADGDVLELVSYGDGEGLACRINGVVHVASDSPVGIGGSSWGLACTGAGGVRFDNFVAAALPGMAAHLLDTTAHTAGTIPFTPSGNLGATDVGTALTELDQEKAATGHDHNATYVAKAGSTMTGALVLPGDAAAPLQAAPLQQVQALIAALVGGAPGTLDALNELAASLGNDPNFATTMATALAGKQPLHGNLTALAGLALIANKLAYADGAGTLALTDFTAAGRALVGAADAAAMLAYLGASGGTLTWNTQVASYTLVLADATKGVEMNVAAANTLTVPPNSTAAIPIGSTIPWRQYGAGQTTLTPGAGVTIRSAGTRLKSSAQYSEGTLSKRAADEWVASGDLAV